MWGVRDYILTNISGVRDYICAGYAGWPTNNQNFSILFVLSKYLRIEMIAWFLYWFLINLKYNKNLKSKINCESTTFYIFFFFFVIFFFQVRQLFIHREILYRVRALFLCCFLKTRGAGSGRIKTGRSNLNTSSVGGTWVGINFSEFPSRGSMA